MLVGAASITAVLNTRGDIEVPFVFGGDGGTLVVPGLLRQGACEALVGLRAISQATFGMSLRVGAIPVADLRAQGADVRVRKYELSAGNYLAMFAGGGVELADSLLKNSPPGSPYLLQGQSNVGEPANVHSMKFRWPPRGLRLEARASAGEQSLLRRYFAVLVSSLIQLWCERFDRQAGSYNAPVYRGELRSNTDFRKYDGILRMVLDVSEIQAERIERHLKRERDAGRLVYGVHLADTALMTCLVFSFEQSEHVHFIDGSDGGYAMAALAFKSRVKERQAVAS